MGLKPKEGIQEAPGRQHIIFDHLPAIESLGFEWVNLDSTSTV
jgi:hypothetical protein